MNENNGNENPAQNPNNTGWGPFLLVFGGIAVALILIKLLLYFIG